MERHLLFVDDQWCRPGDQSTIRAAFGGLQRKDAPFHFHYETAEIANGRYGVEPVLEHLGRLPDLSAMILDVLFGEEGYPLGLDILGEIRSRYPLLPVIIMTTVGREIRTLERAMELGATEYLVKTPTLRQLEEVLATYVEEEGESSDYALWGNSPALRRMRAEVARVAMGGLKRVLVIGESGSGKELVARAIHRQGMRRGGTFVAKNCAYASTELLDSDLFGHERGAFTGAERAHAGLLEAADKGVLFLDEVSSMPHELQGKLLRCIETGSFERLGSRESRSSDFSLICATNLDPEELVQSGRLREDLYYRISEYSIRVPPLREREGDVAILAELFLKRLRARREGSQPGAFPAERFSDDALLAMRRYQWPGNVRQLRNVVSQASIRARGPEIELALLPEQIAGTVRVGEKGTTSALSGFPTAVLLDENPSAWPAARLRHELEMAVEAKEYIATYKGRHWKAEFMRLMYPECRAQSAKGFQDLIRRLTRGPWGSAVLERDPELQALLRRLIEG